MQYIPATHKYIPRIEQRQNNLFTEEYYSSTDTKIYIDDEEQTEIGYISYSLQEQLKPLYGYNSSTWDEVAIGNRIVTGTIKVPIKNPKEQTPLEDIIEAYNSDDESWLDYNRKEDDNFDKNEWVNPFNNIPNVITAIRGTPYSSDYQTDNQYSPPYRQTNPYNESGEQDGNFIGTLYYNKSDSLEDKQEYIPKLNKLGYNISQMDNTRFANTIKDFQVSIGREPTGILDAVTKEQIDYLSENYTDTIIRRGTVVYSKPSETGTEITTTDMDYSVRIIDTRTNLNGWQMVEFANKIKGYVYVGDDNG